MGPKDGKDQWWDNMRAKDLFSSGNCDQRFCAHNKLFIMFFQVVVFPVVSHLDGQHEG
jgi:hypothetical protein